ncbi:MAG: S8 family peptidase [Anaerocolumna sp.]
MSDEEKFKIVSNAYADLLIKYDEGLNEFDNFSNSSFNIIDQKYAVVHIPVSNITPDSISKYGYFSLPTCYGLLSAPGYNSTGISRIRNIREVELRGRGILVGFVDTGIEYTHPAFKNPDNTTRIISIWDQTIDSDNNYPDGFYYGTEYNRNLINQALKSEHPLSIVPSEDEIGHGTMLAGVAAGTPVRECGFMGVVPSAEFVIVKLKPAKPYLKKFFSIPDEAICYQENDILLGVKYITQVAERLNRPIAMCIGLGSSQGDHAGHGMLSQYLTSTCENPKTTVVVSAGNEGNTGHHYYGEKKPDSTPDTVELFVANNDKSFSMEFWGLSPNNFWIDIFAPTSEFVSRIPPTLNHTLYLSHQNTNITVDVDSKESQINKQFILFRFQKPIPGIWRFLIYEEHGDLTLRYHIWLPTNGFLSPGTFFLKSNNDTTITTPGNSGGPICITAYNYVNQSLYYNASCGFTLLNKPGPDLAAPGVSILCPAKNNKFINATGSSLAAAHATGVAAMLLEWGIVRGNFTAMNNTLIKKLLIQGAGRSKNFEYPNPDWGYGILDIFKTYQMLVNDKTRITEMYLKDFLFQDTEKIDLKDLSE